MHDPCLIENALAPRAYRHQSPSQCCSIHSASAPRLTRERERSDMAVGDWQPPAGSFFTGGFNRVTESVGFFFCFLAFRLDCVTRLTV
jgi:hypothetical protein